GLAIARAFQANGDQVAITSRSGQGPDGVRTVKADVTDMDSVDQAFTEVEKADVSVEILVNNAGINEDQFLVSMSEEDFEDVVNTNLTGSFRALNRATRGMIRLKKGRVIFISSVVGLYGSPGQINYAASKAGTVGM